MTSNSDFASMVQKAIAVMQHAYAPYSNFHVGAALITTSGRIFVGCNVENASYGLTVCAERNAITTMIAHGETKIAEMVVLSSAQILTTPCGACRQTIAEFSDHDCQVHMAYGHDYHQHKTLTSQQLLPFGFEFNPDDLA